MLLTLRLAVAISFAAAVGLTFSAAAQQREQWGQHPGGHPAPGFHPPGGGPRIVHGLGERGYSFRGPGGMRREIVAFSPRERDIWHRGRWHHERRFGRFGYWYEVNGAWYFYDQPFDGPPTYVSEVEFVDPDLDPGDPSVEVEAAPPVVVAPPPVVVAPPAVCVGPLCVR